MSRIICVIPARYESTRFPGKPLADIGGKPMIQHVYEGVLRNGNVSSVTVATDDERIFEAVRHFGGNACMTSREHASGTDRIAEAVQKMNLDEHDIIVNVQGDQPLFQPVQIDEVTGPLLRNPAIYFCTLIYRIRHSEEIFHPNAVKVVFDKDKYALYFSRAPIPFVREKSTATDYYKHHGIYSYKKSFLLTFTGLPRGYLEKREALEQLRALEAGYRIKVVETQFDSVEVDTPEELQKVKEILLNAKEVEGKKDW
ncbi:MAG: 3-deoxy-manno-octulosonate cytidylyltransferase [Syntrophales bacterium]|jgi:3-deoxy-manno-octulosonate cytidylyltransferase (CMP-KDO synthetase)|nr:3-deoxy-manno-octulosonate cytidylyltransferase [Syntrophales bacterium]MDY0044538.1 3-deoxy-manno-octulosonate cytidylyltransferase [Syntrophales bacterium]